MKKGINIKGNFKEFDLVKGKKTGVYTDTPENRKLGRVGQKYKKEDNEDGSGKTKYSKRDRLEADIEGLKEQQKRALLAMGLHVKDTKKSKSAEDAASRFAAEREKLEAELKDLK